MSMLVDNCTIIESSSAPIKAFKDKIRMCFQLTDLGPISWLLDMKVIRDHTNCTISLSQEPYINVVLMKYNPSDTKLVAIPLDPHIQLLEK